MDELEIRLARDGELTTVAALRWQWLAEQGEVRGDPARFRREFAGWAREHAATHECLVVLKAGRIVGMAWPAAVPRVPTPHSADRHSGDVQCVYVVPEERNGGVGARLVGAVLDRARQRGFERVTVHSSVRAVPAYRRWGFDVSPRLLQVRLA